MSAEQHHQDHPSLRPYSEADFDGYRAAPLLIVGEEARKSIRRHQDRIAQNLALAARDELTGMVKPPIVKFVASSIIHRMHEREGLNGTSFAHRLYESPRFDLLENASEEEIIEACDRSRKGGATVKQNDISRRVYGMGSIELANLTMISKFRKDQERPMWDEVSELVGRDAQPKPSDVYRMALLGFDPRTSHHQHIAAMRIGLKSRIGYLEDGTEVKARTTAIINTSPSSGFDQSIVETFRSYGENYKAMSELDEFKNAVNWLISSDLSPEIVLARNETVYENNPKVQAMITTKREIS